jgi:hypothetical protein
MLVAADEAEIFQVVPIERQSWAFHSCIIDMNNG